MKRLLSLLAALLLLPPISAQAAEASASSAGAFCLLHAASGTVLAAENADRPLPMASTTKLMTALTAVRLEDPSVETEIRPEWTGVEGSSMYLSSGERYSLGELIEGMLLVSGNDAAVAVAGTVSGDMESFVAEMNRLAGSMGLSHTHFTNPHGLSEDEHFSSAEDLATIMAAVLREPFLREIVSMRSANIHGKIYVNHNKLLWQCEGVNGGKTGYTKAAGRCLVTSCERNGMELICVTLADPDDWNDHASLYDWAFSSFEEHRFSTSDTLSEIPIISGSVPLAGAALAEDAIFCLPAGTKVETALRIPDFSFAPIRAGDRIGECVFCVDGEEIKRLPIVWKESVSRVLSVRPRIALPAGKMIGSIQI